METSAYIQLSARLLRVLGAFGPQTIDEVARRMDPPVLVCRVAEELSRLVQRGWAIALTDGRYASLDMEYRPSTPRSEAFYEETMRRALAKTAGNRAH
jgi:hypothetical protein